MLSDVLEVKLRQWLLALAVAVAYSALAASCSPQPVMVSTAAGQEPAGLMAAKQRQADREAAAWEAVYGRMSDAERMHGVVLEPSRQNERKNHD